MKLLCPLLGLIMIIAAIVLGLYVGVYVCLIGGIVGIINAIKATPVEALPIAWNIVKIVFAGTAGWLAFFVLFVPGVALLGKD